jgi:hypothetical protein
MLGFETLKDLTKHLANDDHIGQVPFLSKVVEEADKSVIPIKKKSKEKRFPCNFPGCGRVRTL